jgi:hypothetical protein
MPIRTRRMKSSGKGVKLPERSSSSDKDTKMFPPTKSMVDKLRSYLDTRIQERMEAFNENVQTEQPMVQKDDTTQLLLQILNDQNGRMKKLEECLEKLQHSLVHLMKNDLTQELKLGGHKMPYDFNLEKADFSLKNNDQFTKDDEESETKSMKWSDINSLDNLTQECKMPYDLHFEKNDFYGK